MAKDIEPQNCESRLTGEKVEVVTYDGSDEQAYGIINWVINNDGRAQGQIKDDRTFTLQVHEKGVGFVTVKPGDNIVKSESGYEIHPILSFSQLFNKVNPIVKVMSKPDYFEAVQFTGGSDNEDAITAWLNNFGVRRSFRKGVPGTTIVYYEMLVGEVTIYVDRNHWIVRIGDGIQVYSESEFSENFQEVKYE